MRLHYEKHETNSMMKTKGQSSDPDGILPLITWPVQKWAVLIRSPPSSWPGPHPSIITLCFIPVQLSVAWFSLTKLWGHVSAALCPELLLHGAWRLHVAVYVAFFPDVGTVEIMTAAAGQNDVGNFFFLFHNLSPPRTLPKPTYPRTLLCSLSLFKSAQHTVQSI